MARDLVSSGPKHSRKRSEVLMRRIASAACAVAALILFAAIEPRQGELRAAEAAPFPIDFIENRGQWDRTISFAARHGPIAATIEHATVTLSSTADLTTAVSLTFESAAPDAAPVGEGRRPTRYNFYIGPDPGRWRSDVPAFAAVAFRHLYPGGDVFVGGTMASADFPSFADPSFAPGVQSPAFVARLGSNGSILRYATFIGGWHAQLVHRGLTVDAAGNAVLVGQTFSPDFPTTAGAFDRVGVNKDAFVVRLNPTGGLIFSTLVGGSGEDDAAAVAYDPAGNIVVGGTTASRDFPTTPGAFRTTYNTPNAPADGGAEGDMFVARLTPDGTSLTYGTFLGGPQSDVLEDLVVDSNGFVTVCGWVTGNNVQVFVTTPDAFDRTWNGSQDAAIARLKLDGAGAADLKYATLIGGASQDNLWKAAIDPTNPELVTFAGRSWSNNYPVTAGVVRPTNPPFSALFPDVEAGIITRFRFPAAGGASLVWSTYHHADRITALTVNNAGEPIVVGPSAPWDLVTTRGAVVRTADGSGAPGRGLISRLSADATQYVYQSFFGGSGGIADNFQSVPQVAYVSGNTV